MQRHFHFYMMLMVFLLPVILSAQFTDPGISVNKPIPDFKKPYGFLDHLLDPTKFDISHSYSVMVTSIGKHTVNQGLYLSTLNYQFSDPLLMQVRIGYSHQPFGGPVLSNEMNGKLFLQRAMLQYKPTENMSLTLDYQVIPASFYSPYYLYRR